MASKWTRNPNQLLRNFDIVTRSISRKSKAPPTHLSEFKYLSRCPPEVRAAIFSYVLEPMPETPTLVTAIRNPAVYQERRVTSKGLEYVSIRCGAQNVRLLETCKWIHSEAAALLYRNTKFEFENHHRFETFLESLSSKYLDYIKDVIIRGFLFYKHGISHWPCIHILRNLKTLSIPLCHCAYKDAQDAKKCGFLLEELEGLKQLLPLRGLSNIIIRDPANIPVYYPELVAIKKQVDEMITKAVTRPRNYYGGPRFMNMDTFSRRN